jgi:hypothetical protein
MREHRIAILHDTYAAKSPNLCAKIPCERTHSYSYRTFVLLFFQQMDADDGLFSAVERGDLPCVMWLIHEGGANVNVTSSRQTPLIRATQHLYNREGSATFLWLVEHGGADVTLTGTNGHTVWDHLHDLFINYYAEPQERTVLSLLKRALLLKAAPPAYFAARFPTIAQVINEGARLRAQLPAYLAQRRAVLDAHCPLLAPLRTIVAGYQKPTTTEELWATGLGQAP